MVAFFIQCNLSFVVALRALLFKCSNFDGEQFT